ncbi:CD44 antigen isoform X9 [Marmota flaviventris]|uniref:CD44 antigen isoform X9 n=1 Tax=Marmota flaviventris TaxID=93162 RepID=UPI000FFF7A31|nr:CD44 antigen isoform X9 [Marmota flaviventris]
MDKLWWRAAWGLCLVQLSLAQLQIDLNITCRYAGVFHVEKNGRYSISRTEAPDLCKAFNSTLPTMAQMQQALAKGFETCRYGFIQGHVVIPRIHPNAICAANNTGVYILTSNTSHYDTYCFNASAPLDEDCTSVTDLPNSFDGIVTITIVNRDGTRYSKKGEYRTHEEDINPSQPMDEDMSSGSSSERSTSGGYTIFHTHLPTSQPSTDQEDAGVSENNPTTTLMSTSATAPETATKKQEAQDWLSWLFQPSESRNHLLTTTMSGTDPNAISTGWEPNEENEDERDKHVSFSGSGIDDDEDFVSSTISTTPRVSDHTEQNQDWNQWRPSHSNPEAPLETTTRITDVDKNGSNAHGENRTQEPEPPLTHHEHQDEEEAPHSTSTTWETSSSTTEETATQREQWFGNGWHGGYHQTPREESHSTAGTTEASAHDGHPDQRMTTQSQEDHFWTDHFDPISHPMGRGHQTERTMDVDSSHSTTLQPPVDPNTDSVEDVNGTGPISVTTQHSHSQSFSTSHGELEEDKEQTTISTITSSNRNDGRGGRRGGNPPEDSTTSLEGKTSHYPDTRENRTLIPVTPAQPGVFGVTEVPVGDFTSNVDGSLPGDQDAGGRSHTTHGSGSAGHSSGSQEGGATTTSGPIRKPHIPEWLIILASLLALALILAVCIAVNSRRRCGQKKKLVINNGNGTVDDRKPSGLNGEASKSQEMVHLVNKESSETPDQFMTADETRNLQNVDMKIGV